MAPHAPSKAAQRAEARKGITTSFQDLGLHSACATSNLGLVKYALLNGQPVNSVLNGVQPLHAAASAGNEAIVRMLIENGADVNAPRLPRRYTSEKTRSTIAVGTSGSTALHFAAANGHTDVIRVLLAFGANPSAKEKHGLTPEALATQNGHEQAAEVLRQSLDEVPTSPDDPSASRTSLRSLGKKRLHPQRSFDALALKMTQQASNPHLPSLHLHQSTSSVAPSRRSSISSTMTDETRRSILPAVLEKASAQTKNAIGSLTSIRKSSEDPSKPTIPEEDAMATSLSSASSALSRNNSTSSYNSRAAHGYRPRLSSQLSGRRATSPIPGNNEQDSPRIQIDDDSPSRPLSKESNKDSLSGSSNVRASSTLFRQHVRDRSNSNASSGSSYSRRGGISPFARAHPAVATRGSRSNSVGTEARSSSSPSSSYSGFGHYAPSNATTAATSPSMTHPTTAYAPLQQPLNALSPLYESPVKRSDTGSSITTSAEARSQAKKMERDILSTASSTPKDQQQVKDGRSALAQKLASYGQTLSLEKKLKALELNNGPGYRWETIGKDGTHQATPVTAGQLKPPAEIVSPSPVKASTSSNTGKLSKSPGRRSSIEELAPGVPQWRAVPSGDRLVPPSSIGKRSVSPAGTLSSTSSAMARNRPSKDRAVAIDRPDSPASTSGSSGIVTGAPGISYEVISSPTMHKKSSSEATNGGKASGTKQRVGSDKAHSTKGGSSVTSAKEQVAIDAAEQARIDATIPHAQITVPQKKKRFFG